MNDRHDHIGARLSDLAADVEAVHLPGPAAARRRAAQRTRNQLTTGVLTATAAVAVGFFGFFQQDLLSAPSPQPADTPTANATPPPGEALMTLDDVTGDSGIAWSATDQPGEPFECAPEPSAGSVEAHYINPDGGRFDHFVESSSDAQRRFEDLRADVESCVATMEEAASEGEPHRLVEVWEVDGVGDEAWMAAYFAPLDTPSEFGNVNVVQLRLIRFGDYVSVVARGGPGQEFNEAMSLDDSVTAATRLCGALGETCVDDPTQQRLFPESVGDLPGWLTAEDVAQTIGLPQITEGTEPQPADGGWNYVGLPLDPAAAGARSVDTRLYVDPTNTTGASATETIARFPGAAAANAHFDELVDAADAFQQEGDVIQNTGEVNGDGFRGVTWRAQNDEFGTVFVYGVVISGDAVAVVTHGFGEEENRDVTPDQFAQLMRQAGTRLGADDRG